MQKLTIISGVIFVVLFVFFMVVMTSVALRASQTPPDDPLDPLGSLEEGSFGKGWEGNAVASPLPRFRLSKIFAALTKRIPPCLSQG